jgi:aminopeptidase N
VFRAVVYNKGALVLHMLRRLVGDEPFFSGLREFYRRARFTKAGTDDLRRVFEEVTGRPLERFFRRWVHDSALPRFSWDWQIDPADSTSVVLRFRETSQADFDLPVTVTLNYADGSSAAQVVAIDGAEVVTRLPLSAPLASVSVNADSASLARFQRK